MIEVPTLRALRARLHHRYRSCRVSGLQVLPRGQNGIIASMVCMCFGQQTPELNTPDAEVLRIASLGWRSIWGAMMCNGFRVIECKSGMSGSMSKDIVHHSNIGTLVISACLLLSDEYVKPLTLITFRLGWFQKDGESTGDWSSQLKPKQIQAVMKCLQTCLNTTSST